MARNDSRLEERGSWAFGHKRESGPHVPATFIEFLVPAELCAQVHLMPTAL